MRSPKRILCATARPSSVKQCSLCVDESNEVALSNAAGETSLSLISSLFFHAAVSFTLSGQFSFLRIITRGGARRRACPGLICIDFNARLTSVGYTLLRVIFDLPPKYRRVGWGQFKNGSPATITVCIRRRRRIQRQNARIAPITGSAIRSKPASIRNVPISLGLETCAVIRNAATIDQQIRPTWIPVTISTFGKSTSRMSIPTAAMK